MFTDGFGDVRRLDEIRLSERIGDSAEPVAILPFWALPALAHGNIDHLNNPPPTPISCAYFAAPTVIPPKQKIRTRQTVPILAEHLGSIDSNRTRSSQAILLASDWF